MIHHVTRMIEILAVFGTVASLAYYGLCLWSAAGFLRERKAAGEGDRPKSFAPVSILKPLKGTDPEMYESLRSHCLQNFEEYEIIFGVSEPDDPAIQLIERLKLEFPQHAIRLTLCAKNLGANTKVSNLAQMLPEAKHERILVNDSDIRVRPDYVWRVTAPLGDPQVGLVTCLYRGVAGRTPGSRLESMGISTDFSAGVLAARQLEGSIRFGLGSTLAFRRRDIEAIGGFERFADYLADDYEIGRRLAAQGLKVKLSDVVVETYLPHYTLRQFADHQLRWGRTVRDSRRWGYLGLGLTFGIPWALLVLVLSQGVFSAWALLVAVFSVRVAVALLVGWSVLRDRQVLPSLPLLPLRDLVALLVWIASLAGHTVVWRGDSFKLKDGKLARISA
ncbi:MAG TPA: bacteriohopanetetrol glucosamine biosynthesis glycosyltransferase HpnI [Terriglobales bacterium]|jgi:ceramide glucosyltransferase|nr:bacteriohopanetetrol glucosamine biosynthesis glycosyltransferase HpnI [Terriglobales bacterium]